MAISCSICGQIFARPQNLRWHLLKHNPNLTVNSVMASPKIQATPNDNLNSRINMLEDAIEVMTTGSGFIGSQPHYNPYLQQPQQPIQQPQQEDSFDKTLKQYMQIMMIKQLASATNSNSLTDFIKMQSFMDGREEGEEDENPLVNALIQQFAPQFGSLMGKKKIEGEQTQMMNLPVESELLAMDDSKIVKLLIPYREQMNQLKLSKEQAYQNILNFYPNFPEQRFLKIWKMLVSP